MAAFFVGRAGPATDGWPPRPIDYRGGRYSNGSTGLPL